MYEWNNKLPDNGWSREKRQQQTLKIKGIVTTPERKETLGIIWQFLENID
jgi:hypothetical protein